MAAFQSFKEFHEELERAGVVVSYWKLKKYVRMLLSELPEESFTRVGD